MFVTAYWWKVHPGKEVQFRTTWRQGTRIFRRHHAGYGVRLMQERDGRFVAMVEWPDEAAWRASIDTLEPEWNALCGHFADIVIESPREPMLKMIVTDDFSVSHTDIDSAVA